MPQKVKIKAILHSADLIKDLWKKNPNFRMAEVTIDDFVALCDAGKTLAGDYEAKTLELRGLRRQRDNAVQKLHGLVARYRTGMLGNYGRGSHQYKLAVETRVRPRKRRARQGSAGS